MTYHLPLTQAAQKAASSQVPICQRCLGTFLAEDVLPSRLLFPLLSGKLA